MRRSPLSPDYEGPSSQPAMFQTSMTVALISLVLGMARSVDTNARETFAYDSETGELAWVRKLDGPSVFGPLAGESAEVPPLRLLHTAGCDCGRSCGGGIGRCDRLAADRCALRPIGTNSSFASCTAQSCRGNCNVRRSRGRSDAYRRGFGTWRIGKLLLGAFRPRGYVPQARQDS